MTTFDTSEEGSGALRQSLKALLQLLEDPALIATRRRADERPLTWHEFTLMPRPEGLTYAQTWEVLTALRRQTAIEHASYLVDSHGRCGWYTFTRSMRTDLSDIDRRCHKGSRLDLLTRSQNAAHFVAEAHINDALPAVREDGVALASKRAREILLRERPPVSPEERVLLNTHGAMLSLESLEGPCTPELIWDIYRQVANGAEQRTVPLAALEAGIWLDDLSADEVLEVISEMVNHDGFEETHHPILLAIGVAYLFTNARPLPSWNGVMATLVTRLLFLQSRLPVLALVPIMRLHRAWQDGAFGPPMVPVAQRDSFVVADDEIDFTIYNATLVRLVRLELDATERALQRIVKRDEDLSGQLTSDSGINHRQRAVLSAAMRDSSNVFRIDAHQRTHKVAYATARSDLLGLADMGLLRCRRANRAFIFSPAPGLSQLLRKRVSGRTGGHASESK